MYALNLFCVVFIFPTSSWNCCTIKKTENTIILDKNM
jgi:hypothetical protein